MKENRYIEKYAFCDKQIEFPVSPDLNMIVVIPCYKEPDLINTLVSLSNCYATNNLTEVIVVINHSENETEEIKEYNQKTIELGNEWIENNPNNHVKFYLLKAFDLPVKTAGV